MEALWHIKAFGEEHKDKTNSEYEYISDTVYEKELNLFNQINEYLITQWVMGLQKDITINDDWIKKILAFSKELDSTSPDYNEMLIDWVDKYNEDYIDRFNWTWYKFNLRNWTFVLLDTTERDAKFKDNVFSSVWEIKSSSWVSMVDLFKSFIPNKDVNSSKKSEAERVKVINLNIKQMIKNIGKRAAMFGL